MPIGIAEKASPPWFLAMHFQCCSKGHKKSWYFPRSVITISDFKEIAVSGAIGKMSGCITTDYLAALYSELVGSDDERQQDVKTMKMMI